MSIITFVLFMSAKVLLTAIWIFLMAIPSGMGLGIGLHTIKRFISWRARKKTPSAEQRVDDNYKDFISETEVAVGAKA